jgi:hypothetical protein
MSLYFRAAAACVTAMPLITLALWLGSRVTGFPWTFRQAVGGGLFLAGGMFLAVFTGAGRSAIRRERERERLNR